VIKLCEVRKYFGTLDSLLANFSREHFLVEPLGFSEPLLSTSKTCQSTNIKYVGRPCGVEVWRGGLGGTYRLPTLSVAGASLFPPCFRFHTPLSEPDVRICRIRLSEKTHAIAVAIACDAVCNF